MPRLNRGAAPELKDPFRDVLSGCQAGHVGPGVARRHAHGPAPDHHDQLYLPVHVATLGDDDGADRDGQRGAELGEGRGDVSGTAKLDSAAWSR